MAMKPNLEIEDVTIQQEPHIGMIPLGASTEIPEYFTARFTVKPQDLIVLLDIEVMDSQPHIIKLCVEPSTDGSINRSVLRTIPIDYLFRVALATAIVGQTHTGLNDDLRKQWVDMGGGAPGRVRIAAELYNKAVEAHSASPAKDVGEALGVSRANIARYLRVARAQEPPLIPPPSRRWRNDQ